jgi:hypothetical protein
MEIEEKYLTETFNIRKQIQKQKSRRIATSNEMQENVKRALTIIENEFEKIENTLYDKINDIIDDRSIYFNNDELNVFVADIISVINSWVSVEDEIIEKLKKNFLK